MTELRPGDRAGLVRAGVLKAVGVAALLVAVAGTTYWLITLPGSPTKATDSEREAVTTVTAKAPSTPNAQATNPANRPTTAAAAAAAGATSAPSRADRLAPIDLPPVEPRLVESVRAAGRRVALTFDLCEGENDSAGFDKSIIRTLVARRVNATFFMGGKWATTHTEAALQLGAQPLFEIGNHSWSHLDLRKTTTSQTTEQITLAQDAIFRQTGRTPRVFRFPFGTYSESSLRLVGEAGMTAIQWNVVTGDPDPDIDASDILRAVKTEIGNGAIIIMHANGRGWHTAEALPSVLDWLGAMGYEPVTVSELLSYE